MSDPYSPSQTAAHEYLAVISELPWHAKMMIAILVIGASLSGWTPIQYTIHMLWTGASAPNIFWALYLRFLYMALLLGTAYLLYKRSKQAALPLFFALPLFAWFAYRFFSSVIFPPTYNLYGSFISQLVQYIPMLPHRIIQEIVSGAILCISIWYCWYFRKSKKSLN